MIVKPGQVIEAGGRKIPFEEFFGGQWNRKCDWCEKKVDEDQHYWFWGGPRFTLRMHIPCYFKWTGKQDVEIANLPDRVNRKATSDDTGN